MPPFPRTAPWMGLVPLAPHAGFGVMEGSSTPIPGTPFSIPARLEFLASKHQCPVLGTQRPLLSSLNPLLPSPLRVPLTGPQTCLLFQVPRPAPPRLSPSRDAWPPSSPTTLGSHRAQPHLAWPPPGWSWLILTGHPRPVRAHSCQQAPEVSPAGVSTPGGQVV